MKQFQHPSHSVKIVKQCLGIKGLKRSIVNPYSVSKVIKKKHNKVLEKGQGVPPHKYTYTSKIY